MAQPTHITKRYQILDKLGQGGMGAVYKVYDRLDKQAVALKQVAMPVRDLLFSSKGNYTSETAALIQEFSTLASLRHPNIISVLDYGLSNGQPFFTMELVPQAQNILEAAHGKSEQVQIELLIQVLEALRYLHRRGVIHRDLKPDNVLVLADGQVKVLDFGLSVNAEVAKGRAGTLAYMAPETLQNSVSVPQSDFYAIGVMAYEMVTGSTPFKSDDIIGMVFHAPDMSKLGDHPARLVIERLLLKTPGVRYSTTEDCIQAFQLAFEIPAIAESAVVRESFLQASTFVGRDTDLQQLTAALATLDTANAFFLVGGESGVGKSRLLDELRIAALVDGAIVLRGQAVEDGGLPFQLWRNIVRRLLLMVEVSDLQASILKDIAPDVSSLIGRDVADAPQLTGQAYQERLVVTIVDLLRDLQQPLVLLLEDLQWAIESLAPLKQILQVRDQLFKVMIVANFRDDEAPDLTQTLATMTPIKLERLSLDAVKKLSLAMLGDAGAKDAVVELLQTESEGNLYFLVETVRALAEESGQLQRIGRDTLPARVLTGGMQQLMRRRLNKVDAQYRDMQTLAAIIGREIDITVLQHLYDEKTVQAWLANANEYAVLDVQENKWRFAHDKLRETVFAVITPEKLRSLHRVAAIAIEQVYPDDANYNEVLLNHWQQVGDLDKTYDYALSGAENMIEFKGTYASAEALLQGILDRLPTDDKRCIALWNWLVRCAELQGDYSTGQVYGEQAQRLATTLDDQKGLASSLLLLGNIASDQGDYIRAADLYQQSLAIRQQLGDQHDISGCLHNLGIIARSQGDYVRATDLYQQSLALYQQLSDQPHIASCLHNLANIASDQGDYIRATDLCQQGLTIRQQLGLQHGSASSLYTLGLIARYQGDDVRATDLYQQSLAIRQQLGDQHGIASCLNNLGNIASDQGDYARAADLYQRSLVICQQLGYQKGITRRLSNIGWLMLKQDDLEAVKPLVEELTISSRINTPELSIYFIVTFAGVFIHKAQVKRTAQLLGFVEGHPLKKPDLQRRIDELMPRLEQALAPDELEAALEQGKDLDLDTIVAELLQEFAPSDEPTEDEP